MGKNKKILFYKQNIEIIKKKKKNGENLSCDIGRVGKRLRVCLELLRDWQKIDKMLQLLI